MGGRETGDVRRDDGRRERLLAAYNEYGDGRIYVGIRADYTNLSTFDDVLDHVFEMAPLEPAPLEATVTPSQRVSLDDIEVPDSFMLVNPPGPKLQLSPMEGLFDGGGDPSPSSVGEAFGQTFNRMFEEMADSMNQSGARRDQLPELDGEPTTFSLEGVFDEALGTVVDQVDAELSPASTSSGDVDARREEFEVSGETPEDLLTQYYNAYADLESDEEMLALVLEASRSDSFYTVGHRKSQQSGVSFDLNLMMDTSAFDPADVTVDVTSVEEVDGQDIGALVDDQSLLQADPDEEPMAMIVPPIAMILGTETAVEIAAENEAVIADVEFDTPVEQKQLAHFLATENGEWKLVA